MGGSAETYYAHLQTEDYYLKIDSAPGLWAGQGAGRLGLFNEVRQEEFQSLYRGFDPIDPKRKLVQNAGKMPAWRPEGKGQEGEEATKPIRGLRQPGWVLTMSTPKSLSTLYAVSSEEEQRWIEKQVLEAARETISFNERATVTRTGKGGVNREQTDLVAGVFLHTTSRQVGIHQPDPQLHVHATIFNIGVSGTEMKGGKFVTRSIKSNHFYDLQRASDQVFMTGLAARISSHYKLTDGQNSWEVKGVPTELCKEFSKRSQQIEEVAPRGTHARKREVAALQTRQKKQEVDRAAIDADWEKTAERYGFGRKEAAKLRKERDDKFDSKIEALGSVAAAGAHLFESRIYFSKEQFIDVSLRHGQARGVTKREIENAAQNYLTKNAVFIGTDVSGRGLWANRDLQADKLAALKEKIAAREEQIVQDRKLITEEMKRLSKVRSKVIGVTWSGKEAKFLENKTGVKTNTVSRMMKELEQGFDKTEPGKLKKMWAEYKYATHQMSGKSKRKYLGQEHKPQNEVIHGLKHATWKISKKHKDYLDYQVERKERYEVKPGTVVVIHGQKPENNKKMEKFVSLVEKRGGTVLFSHDEVSRIKAETKVREEVREAIKQSRPQQQQEPELQRVRVK
jgi:conjugative relaxase-like TrwC/TraI family protein